MTDKGKPDPAAKLKAPVAASDPNKLTYFLVPTAVMQTVIKQLGKQRANKVHGLLNMLNQCRTVQLDAPEEDSG